MVQKREIFTSKVSMILTMIGVSIGLGNVWRFPYMMGKYGGSAFLFVYLFFTFALAIPAVMAEWALGRSTRKGPIGAFSAVAGPVPGKILGYLLLFTVLIANSYYLVVIANVVYTGVFSMTYGFDENNFELFQTGLNDGVLQYQIAVGTLLASLFVIHRGLNKGIETVSKLFVPFFTVTLMYLVFNAFFLEGAPAKFALFLKPDFSAMHPRQIFAALGQAAFSLGLGGTFLLIYGSYLKDDADIPKSAIITGLGDASAALLAGLFVIPSILVFDLDMAAGPGLIFSTLPKLFSVMPAGRLIGSLFMAALFVVAFLSNVAALEVLAGGINDGRKQPLSRTRIVVFIGFLEAGLILPSALHPPLIGTLDLIFGSAMQMFGSAMAVLGVAWGLGQAKALQEIFGGEHTVWHRLYYFWIRWLVPGVLLIVLASYIYTSI
ncbi:MAG: sodium-dependent transporter [bacterium]